MYFFFLLFAIVGIASAIMVVTRKNVMHAALFLLLTFLCVGAIYVTLRAELLAAMQVLVYAGAVMVLFLFAILLINIPRSLLVRQWTGQSLVAVVLASVTGLWIVLAVWWGFAEVALDETAASVPLGTPTAIGRAIFTDYVLPFEIASLVLLAAMIGALYLARETAPETPASGLSATPAHAETSEAD